MNIVVKLFYWIVMTDSVCDLLTVFAVIFIIVTVLFVLSLLMTSGKNTLRTSEDNVVGSTKRLVIESVKRLRAPSLRDKRSITTKMIIGELIDESERLVKELSIRVKVKQPRSELKDRCDALKSLGFERAPDVLKAERMDSENSANMMQMIANDEVLCGIKIFSKKYPMTRVITLNTLTAVCNMHGLTYGAVRYYTGSISQKNIDDILRIKVDEKDIALLDAYAFCEDSLSDDEIEKAEWDLEFAKYQESTKNEYASERLCPSPLVIVAAPEYFRNTDTVKTVGGVRHGHPIMVDRIVMQPVNYLDNIYMLIITGMIDT